MIKRIIKYLEKNEKMFNEIYKVFSILINLILKISVIKYISSLKYASSFLIFIKIIKRIHITMQ